MRETILDHAKRRTSIKELAQVLNYDTSYVTRLVKKEFNMSWPTLKKFLGGANYVRQSNE